MPISKNFMLKEIGEEYMIIPLTSDNVNVSKIFNINDVGALIYKCLEENNNIDKIIEKIQQEYEVDYDVAKKDTEDFIVTLKQKGIYHD